MKHRENPSPKDKALIDRVRRDLVLGKLEEMLWKEKFQTGDKFIVSYQPDYLMIHKISCSRASRQNIQINFAN